MWVSHLASKLHFKVQSSTGDGTEIIMKKTYDLVTLIFAAVAAVSAILNIVLTENAAIISWIIAVLLTLSALGMWAVPTFMKNKLFTMIPVLALYAVSSYLQTVITTVLAQTSTQLTDLLPVYFEFETLGLIFTVAFIVAMIFVFKNGCKWASIITVAYTAVMLVSQVQLALTYAMAASSLEGGKTVAALMLMALSFVAAYAAQLAMFLGIGTDKKCTAAAETEAVADESEAAAE